MLLELAEESARGEPKQMLVSPVIVATGKGETSMFIVSKTVQELPLTGISLVSGETPSLVLVRARTWT